MHLFVLSNWPLLVICLGMIACAVVDWWKFKVPNLITFPLILSGWLYGTLHWIGLDLGDTGTHFGVGYLGDAVAGTFLGMGLLYPLYMLGGVGAGDVKMQMGFGAWMGAFFGWSPGWLVIVVGFSAGAIIGGILSAILIVIRGEYAQNRDHLRVILTDLVTQQSIKSIHDRAQARKPRWHRIPYGVPLCLGFVGYLLAAPHLMV